MQLLKANRWGQKHLSFLSYSAIKACMNHKNSHQGIPRCDTFLDQNPNKTKQNKVILIAVVFLSVAAVERHVKWQKASAFSKHLLRYYPSIFTRQNIDQSWSRLSFVGRKRDKRWHVKEEKQVRFSHVITSNHMNLSRAILDKSALLNFSKTTNWVSLCII